MFVNRHSELQLLQQRYTSGQAELFVLYGRRRVGKTELLAEFCRDKRHIFFVADLDVEPRLRAGLSAAVNAELLGPATASAVYPTWEDILMLLAQHAQTERLVVVLDEFTYLINAHPPLASILQRLWDSHLRHSQLMLILCGSYIGMMEEAVLGYNAPLYGRRTGQYLLEPLDFAEARPFFQTYELEDQVRAFAIFGGAPAYLRLISAGQPLLTLVRGQPRHRCTSKVLKLNHPLAEDRPELRLFLFEQLRPEGVVGDPRDWLIDGHHHLFHRLRSLPGSA